MVSTRLQKEVFGPFLTFSLDVDVLSMNCINHNSIEVKCSLIVLGGRAIYTISLFLPPYWSKVNIFLICLIETFGIFYD